MSRPNSLKDLVDDDLERLDKIAQAQGWTEIHYDVVSERQCRLL